MILRKVVPLAVCALAVSSVGQAYAQAPFTIRRPGDGWTVREKVPVQIPRSSIPPGGFVGIFIDGKFDVALAPSGPSNRPFTYVWDTKNGDEQGKQVPDGPHTIKAVLYAPVANSSATAAKASSQVHVIVANKIKSAPGPILLRYKYREGENLRYARDTKSYIVSALSGLEATSDQELASVSSRLLLDIQDVRSNVALVRNKLTALTIQQNGQETTLPSASLSASMYQELDPLGRVHYETGTAAGLEEFTSQGLPVDNTLELPILYPERVAVGDTWRTPGRLDIPGLPPALEPRVWLTNKFEGLEWEEGRPTAKIRQTYEGPLGRTIQFGSIEITSPTVKYDRAIYLAYRSGLLVKSTRTLTISGRTSSPLNTTQPGMAPGMAGAFGGAQRFGGMMGGPPPGMMMGGYPGMAGRPGAGMPSGPPPGMFQGYGGYPGMAGRPGGGGMPGGPPPGMMGGYPGMAGRGGRGGFGGRFPGGGYPGMGGPPPGMMGGYPGMAGGGRFGGNRGPVNTPQETDHPVTVKSVTVTRLLPQSVQQASR